MDLPLFSTTVVGSYPQPAWLIDHDKLRAEVVPRVRTPDVWRVGEAWLQEAQDDATRIAIEDQERAGIDVISDGEMRRESYSNRFGTALDGVTLENPFIRETRGFRIPMPRVVAPVRWRGPVEVGDLEFLRRHTSRYTKITLPGPFTLSKQVSDEYYDDPEALALAYADAVNHEARALAAAGADVIQLDEPWLREDPDGANRYAVKAINRALAGIDCVTCIHLCFGYGFIVSPDKPKAYAFLEQLGDCVAGQISVEAAQPHLDLGVFAGMPDKTIVLGVVDLATNDIETPAELVARAKRALGFIVPERLVLAPDCGMKYLTREAAFGKLSALSAAAAALREGVA